MTSSPWSYHPFFKYAAGTLLVLTIIFLFYQVAFLLKPVLDFVTILAAPIIISFLLYYLLRPLIRFLESIKIPRYVSILIIYLIVALLMTLFFAYLGPILGRQIKEMANTSVETWDKMKTSSRSILSNFFHVNLDQEIEQRLFAWAQEVTTFLSKNLLDFVGIITRIATILAVIPFIVFYLLKDDEEFAAGFLGYVPEDFRLEVHHILRHLDTTLSSYINGLVMVSSSLGVMLFIGYVVIGLNYALILSLIAIIFTTIPFVGPFLAIAPALFVGLTQDPFMALKVVVIFVIVQQLESNLISPQIIGQRLHIHPLTLILLLLAAGTIYGLVGLILATPLYAVLKVLVENFYKIYLLHYAHRIKQVSPSVKESIDT
jgi:predicted PurR-regulated permease PerM